MKRSSAQQLAQRYGLPDVAAQRLDQLLEILRDDPGAPTSVTDPKLAVDTHLADCLSGLEVDRLSAASRTADLGSGAGLPGLVLAIARPEGEFDLVEAAGKKCQFIERAVERLGLENVRAVHERVESLGADAGAERYDAVTVRAVSGLPTLIEYASPLLCEAGVLVAWKGKREKKEELAAARAAARLGMGAVEVLRVQPYPSSRDRHLYVFEKVGPTPEEIPRRPGMAAKRPFG